MTDLAGRLRFIQEAERLKSVLRSGFTTTGRQESTAEHTWRLCLLAMSLQDLLGPLDFERLLKLCVVHDLGEALNGDIPATAAIAVPDKSARERRDLLLLAESLPEARQAELLALWEEYEHATTREARVVKVLDKIETIIQHNQGLNPPSFDHAFNLQYGRAFVDEHPILTELRALVDVETARNATHGSRLATVTPQAPADPSGGVITRRLDEIDLTLARTTFQLMAEVFDEERSVLGDAYLASLLARRDFVAFAAIAGGQVVGGITAFLLPLTRREVSEAFIYDIAVHAAHQRKGIGRQLVAALRAAAAAAGVDVCFVPADNEDTHALDFYRNLGGTPAPVTIFTFTREEP